MIFIVCLILVASIAGCSFLVARESVNELAAASIAGLVAAIVIILLVRISK